MRYLSRVGTYIDSVSPGRVPKWNASGSIVSIGLSDSILKEYRKNWKDDWKRHCKLNLLNRG